MEAHWGLIIEIGCGYRCKLKPILRRCKSIPLQPDEMATADSFGGKVKATVPYGDKPCAEVVWSCRRLKPRYGGTGLKLPVAQRFRATYHMARWAVQSSRSGALYFFVFLFLFCFLPRWRLVNRHRRSNSLVSLTLCFFNSLFSRSCKPKSVNCCDTVFVIFTLHFPTYYNKTLP